VKGWLRRLAARPIAEHERRRAFVAAAVVLLAGSVGLSLTRPGPTHARRPSQAPARTTPSSTSPPPSSSLSSPPATSSTPSSIATPAGGRLSGTAPAGAMAAGRAFLDAYLRFSYGQARPRFPDTAPALAAQLARFHVHVGPQLKARHLSLLAVRAGPREGGFEVGALASDGTSTFPVAAIVARIGRRWLAVRVVTAAAGP
jgi:hypothetical protein